MSNSKEMEQNNEYNISCHDPSQFAISNGILIKYLGHTATVAIRNSQSDPFFCIYGML